MKGTLALLGDFISNENKNSKRKLNHKLFYIDFNDMYRQHRLNGLNQLFLGVLN